ncbi:short-chain dehydrogenase/reductase SDR [Mycena albidolilacea]|uniref:Short-chain dehydrogenase/reductase SDR n=1 Tax=Mycena albidolilacea TaxID=1033008 RepID=A0AAD7AS98_9AGAR|nr:short-chain dehydrogenase/reductase SDR [Mycena albidolilacea]
MSSINLQGKVAIITGASSGVGLATVKALLAAGCSVMGADISPAPDSIQATGAAGKFAFTQGDLTKAEAPRALVEACQKKFGEKIDILLNVAGVMDTFASVATVTQAEYERVVAVNLNAPIWLMQEVVKVMKVHKSGAIVNVSSKAGMSGAASGLAYTVSKHGLIGATKNTAWLLKSEGIRCNAICPGAIATNISAGIDPSKYDMQSFAALQPIHTLQANYQTGEGIMTPETVANVLLFLASDLSKDINGVVLPVDNGWSVI